MEKSKKILIFLILMFFPMIGYFYVGELNRRMMDLKCLIEDDYSIAFQVDEIEFFKEDVKISGWAFSLGKDSTEKDIEIYLYCEEDNKILYPDNKYVYGQTKLEGELAVSERLKKFFIVRIAWVFGINGKNFIKTMLSVGKKNDTVRVVCDQIGTPTYTYDLARLLVDMTESEKYGYYHATNEGGYISWYNFACEIFKQAGYDTKVVPVTTEEYGLSKADRPYNSRLDKSKLEKMGFEPLPSWQDALSRYLQEIEY